MEVLLMLVMGATNLLCFLIGAKVGQAVDKGKDIELPKINPLEMMRDREEKRETKREQDRLDVILRNIEAYDGTSRGQEDVPRG